MKWIVGTIFGMVLLLSLVFQSSMAQTEEKTQTISENMALITDSEDFCVGCEPSQLCDSGPKVYSKGVNVGAPAKFNGPEGDFDYSWTIVKHTDKWHYTTTSASGQSITVTPTEGVERIDVFLVVSSKEDESCQLRLCDFFWVLYPPNPIGSTFCENKRKDVTYTYAGPTKDRCVLYTVKDSSGNIIEKSDESSFTAHFLNKANKYPAGKYTVCIEIRPWTKGKDCSKESIVSCFGDVNIILTPKGEITG